MTAYLVVVLLLVPARAGGEPLRVELAREVSGFSSPAACQRHADRRAAEEHAHRADAVRRMGGRVVGTCLELRAPAQPSPTRLESLT